MPPKQLTPEQYVDRFLSEQGITQPLKQSVYWRKFSAKFGGLAEQWGDVIEQRVAGESADPYAMKNSSIDFADAITSQADSARLRRFFAWFLKLGLELDGNTILDFGCDSGLFACFIAKTYPDATVVGLDPCANAIEIANQRNQKLSLPNLKFFCGTLDEYVQSDPSSSIPTTFDVITSLTVFHELLGDVLESNCDTDPSPDTTGFTLNDVDTETLKNTQSQELQRVSDTLKSRGLLISLDRWSGPAMLLRWVRLCENSGLQISTSTSHMLEFKSGPDHPPELMPITVLQKVAKIQRARSSDILSLYAYPIFTKMPWCQAIENDHAAELLYDSLEKVPFYVEEARYNDQSGSMMTCVGVAGGIGYVFRTTSLGYRRLYLLPSIALHEKVDEILAARRQNETVATVTCALHNTDLMESLGVSF